ncbi:MAG: hypothetical protein ACHQ7M_19850, partial [Chloroflexota bacterium]
IVTNAAATTFAAGDSVIVTASRSVPLAFGAVMGMQTGTVKTAAIAISSPLSSIQGQYMLPYAIWAGTASGEYSASGLQPGSQIVYRDNQWPSVVVSPDPNNCGGHNQPPCNDNWQVGPNVNFKGFFNQLQGSLNLNVGSSYPIWSQGGNSSEPTSLICQIAGSGDPVALLPVVTSARENSGVVTFRVSGFLAVTLSQINGCSGGQAMSVSFTGTIKGGWHTDHGTGGGSSSNMNNARLLKLWQ